LSAIEEDLTSTLSFLVPLIFTYQAYAAKKYYATNASLAHCCIVVDDEYNLFRGACRVVSQF
jgi:hypothetical protein